MTHITIFAGDKHDVIPAGAEEVQDIPAWLCAHAQRAEGHEKGERGFACFVRMRPGTDVSIAELNLARAKEGKPALLPGQVERIKRVGYRNHAHVAEVTAIGIDYDEFPTEPPDWRPESWPCDVYAHSTHNYDFDERPGKWRAILPLATPMPIERERALRAVLQDILPRGCVVRAPHQPAYLPTCPAGRLPVVMHVRQSGIPTALDWTQLVDLSAAPEVHSSGEAACTLLGAEFDRRGLVRRDMGTKLDVVCPWAAEHKSSGELAYLYHTDDGLGKFGCAHTACQQARRDSTDVYALWELGGPADAPEAPVALAIAPGARFLDWPELMRPMGEVPWLVRDLELCPGRPPMFISDSGVGKTWTLQALALAVASGQPVFGRFACRQGPVLHLSRDSGLRATKKRYQRLAQGMGISRADIVVFPHSLPLTDKYGQFQRKGFEEIAKEATRGGYALVILDSLAALCPGIDENSTDIGDPLRCTTDDDCVWLWAHHTTKGGEGYRGSGAIKAAAGAIYLGTRDGEHTKWKPIKASEEHEDRPLEPFWTTWETDQDGGARIVCIDSDEAPSETIVSASQQAAWEMLKLVELRGSASATELLAAAGAPPGVKGRNRTRANEVLGSLAHPSGGLLVNPSGERFTLAPGVILPRAAHKIQVSTEAARRK